MVLGPQYLQEIVEKIKVIQGRMEAAQDRHKSHVDQGRRPMEFQEVEKVTRQLFTNE